MNSLHRYIHDLCEAMGLRDWEIILKDEPSDDGNMGQIEVMYGQRRGYMRLAQDFDEQTPEKQRDTVIHELLHCHMHNIWDTFQQIKEELTPATFRITNDILVRDMEFAVDAIAGAWSRLLPLPPVEEVTE